VQTQENSSTMPKLPFRKGKSSGPERKGVEECPYQYRLEQLVALVKENNEVACEELYREMGGVDGLASGVGSNIKTGWWLVCACPCVVLPSLWNS
jgi:hypothetical protein